MARAIGTESTAHRSDRATQGASLSDQVYDYLSARIVSGAIKYGDRLNIKTIAAQLDVSPMPIRDALKRLEVERVVVIRPRSTCYVRVPTQAMTLEAIASRRMLEVFAVREVCEQVTAGQLAMLKRILDDMRRLVRQTVGNRTRTAIDQYIELDRRFHTELCNLAENDYVRRFYRETDMHLNMSFRYGVGVCHGIDETFGDHELIFRHLAENSPRAVDILEAHLRRSEQNILREPTFQMLDP